MARRGEPIANLGTKARPRWQARYRVNGKQRARSFPSHDEAKAFLATVGAAQRAGSYVDPAAGRVSVATYLDSWRSAQHHWRPATALQVESYLRSRVVPTLGHLEMGAVRATHLRAWVAYLADEGLAPGTVETIYRHVSAAFAAAVDDGLIARSPCRTASGKAAVKLPRGDGGKLRREDVLSVAQVGALTEAIPPRYRALVVLGAGCGLRQGEAFGLSADRVDFLRRTVRVDRQLSLVTGPPVLAPPKTTSSNRTVPLPAQVAEALAAHMAGFEPTSGGLLFSGSTGQPIRRNAWSAIWHPAVERAGLPSGATFHDLRHHYASLLIDAGLSVVAVSRLLGHKDATTTLDTYSHWWPESDERARAAVEAAYEGAIVHQLCTDEGS